MSERQRDRGYLPEPLSIIYVPLGLMRELSDDAADWYVELWRLAAATVDSG
jgi:hypothetical protein